MLHWKEFKSAAPEIASIGGKLLYNTESGEVAILATVDTTGRPRVVD